MTSRSLRSLRRGGVARARRVARLRAGARRGRRDPAAARSTRRRPTRPRPRWPSSRAAVSGACRASISTSTACSRRCRAMRAARKAIANYELVGDGDTGHAETVQITYDPAQDHLRQATADLLLRRARSDAAQQARPRSRPAVPLDDLPGEREAARDRGEVHRAARRGEGVPQEDRDDARGRPHVLSGRGVSPGLPGAQSELSVHRDQRPPEGPQPRGACSPSFIAPSPCS